MFIIIELICFKFEASTWTNAESHISTWVRSVNTVRHCFRSVSKSDFCDDMFNDFTADENE